MTNLSGSSVLATIESSVDDDSTSNARAGKNADDVLVARRSTANVLTVDPGMGVVRHVDAGYDYAKQVARERGVKVPMLEDK